MIARSVPVGAVCFRCRLRLLRQLTPIRHFASDATTTPNVDNRTDGGTSQDADQGQSYESRGRPYSGVKRLDLRKRHLSGNRVLTEATASLGSDMLGKPAYAIVMRDAGSIQRRKTPLTSIENEAEPSGDLAARIEALLGSQREPTTLHEVRSNIQGLEPQTDKVLSEKEFRKLQRVLHKGFLSTQIKEYMRWHKSDAQDKSQETATDSSSHPEFPWIREKTPWVPLQSEPNAVKKTDLTLQGYISNTTPAKERLVIRLMRECWGLSITELETQLGETRIKLHNNEFILLMRGTQRFMNTLGKIWLEPGEQIEAFRNQKTLRLVTTRPKAESLLRDLNKTLRSVTTKTFPVILFGSKAPDDEVLEELGRITNSHIRKSHTLRREKQLHVTWIEVAARAARGLTALEDIAHIALRLLLTASGSQQASSSLLSPVLSQARLGRLIVDVTNKDKLGWKDRLAQWARYVHPLTPKKSAVNTALPIGKFELPFEPLERPEKFNDEFEFFPKTKFPSHPVKWSNTTRTSTAAHFGHILHPYQPCNPTPALSDLLVSTKRRVFAPSTPHPLHLTKFETDDSNNSPPLVTTKSTLVLRFWPSPSSNPTSRPNSSEPPKKTPKAPKITSKAPKKTSKAPKKAPSRAGDTPPAPILELRLATSDHMVKRIESLRAISRTHHTDVMLPSSPIDVRFTQTQYETLQAPDEETLNAWQPLFDFLTHARFDLENGKLEMPPQQRFPVPRRLFAIDPTPTSPPSNTRFTTSTKGTDSVHHEHQPDDPDDLVSISYEFVGLELHRSATLPYEGHQLTYTSIEAGQGGGRRAEVILEPQEPPHSIPTWPTEGAEKDRLQEDFLACCSRFAKDRSLWSGL